ncbi:major facilitator superfamily protein [Annulohypoxylon maeteangense]|uniref:major facilitator superfamily protein n=1 Tax=Annulohypoxylon maeteangense TaxID=1927788 RepID=UPI002008E4C1|nr:major facilitator superfamily protein [Annulohypoxylon maeteangense]KAI0883673.1 major facilitator superfamily protein [Annulohypoxylon maeteangense]
MLANLSETQSKQTDPYTWSKKRKAFVFIVGAIAVANSTLGSALPSGAVNFIAEDFGITNKQKLTLPITCYLIGYVLGPVVFGPLSETYGRRPITLITFAFYTIFTLACALAPTFAALVVFRLFAGVFASSPPAVTGGIYADIYADPKARGRAMAGFMAVTTLGPTMGPIMSGYLSVMGWRWTFWVALIIVGASWPFLLLLPETFGPVLRRKQTSNSTNTAETHALASTQLTRENWQHLFTKVLARPVKMFCTESIVLFSCLYLSLIYAIFYLFFEAYPIIFEGMYGMTPGECGLMFLPIAIGALFSFVIYLAYDHIYQRAQEQGKQWITVEEYRRLPLACIGGPLFSGTIFWLAWTAKPSIHWIVPAIAGLPFGIGFLLIFMALINYLADAYGIFAASALAAASGTRSVLGAVLPLATDDMYGRLGVSWATSLLGFLSLLMALIPFAFIRFGRHMRENSKFSQALKASNPPNK